MIELSNERIKRILHEETTKKEELDTVLRSIYTRYMLLYERYFDDIDSLSDDDIAKLRAYHDETRSLVKYYYMDIPLDVCRGLREFENTYTDNLLGPEWHEFLFDSYEDFTEMSKNINKSEEYLKAEFKKENLTIFYDAMDYVFREGFGTGSQSTKEIVKGITGLLFGEEE